MPTFSWHSGRPALAACPLRPLSYMRYLDDIWGIWQHSEAEFDCFLNILNTHDPSITLKSCKHFSSVDFLDTTTFKGPDFATSLTLEVKVFFKPTDTHALLHASSFHSKHTFAGLLKSQLLRFQRICSRTSDFWQAVRVLFEALALRGYSRSARRLSLKGGTPYTFCDDIFHLLRSPDPTGQGELSTPPGLYHLPS